jgi:Ca2+-binding EF-hand superfamily protein
VLTLEDRPAKGQGQRRPAAPGEGKQRLMERADANKDGKLTFEEISAAAPKITKERFDKIDKNHDGFITLEEFQAMRPQGAQAAAVAGPGPRPGAGGGDMFKHADADANGEVTFDEATKAFPNLTKERFAQIDKNGDGVLTADEAPKGRPQGGPGGNIVQLAQRADTDHNGKVTFEEMSKAAPDMTQERFKALDRNKDGVLSQEDRGGGQRGTGGEGKANAIKKLMEADKNGDGKVTYDEVVIAKPGYPKEAFDRFDTNKDGVITTEDLPPAS